MAQALNRAELTVDVSLLSTLPLSLRFAIHRDGKTIVVNDERVMRETLLKDTALYHDNYPFIQAANRRFAESFTLG